MNKVSLHATCTNASVVNSSAHTTLKIFIHSKLIIAQRMFFLIESFSSLFFGLFFGLIIFYKKLQFL